MLIAIMSRGSRALCCTLSSTLLYIMRPSGASDSDYDLAKSRYAEAGLFQLSPHVLIREINVFYCSRCMIA